MKTAAGFLMAFAIGTVCRLAEVPLPAPPVLMGALLVAAISAGYALTDHLIARRAARHRVLSGGPTGESATQKERVP